MSKIHPAFGRREAFCPTARNRLRNWVSSHVWRFVAILEPICAREHAICGGGASILVSGAVRFPVSAYLAPWETFFTPSGRWHTAYTFAFHHHLDQRCQCRELVRFPQGFLPYYMAGRKLPPSFVNAFLLFVGKWPALCRQVACHVRAPLVP